ncbi:hypothetical protein SAMN04488561_3306 [Jiangella alba]|uniref:Uncharacterized protein n=1 Tax=Jiangella alba TaxID=561176 RepID=A0A1H5MRI9_9ACTN|nr:hypothetical protein SAMN04488561_3306 [Jiangella alba]
MTDTVIRVSMAVGELAVILGVSLLLGLLLGVLATRRR